jgi:tetratricopeptide (TPR) repeat protein
MKHALTAAALLVGLALAVPPTGAQGSGGVRGRVVDEKKEPVAEARVLIELQGGITRRFEVTTNEDGEYMQVGLPPGLYRFTAGREGFVSGSLDVRVGRDGVIAIPEIALLSEESAAARTGPDEAAVRERFERAVGLAQGGELDAAEAAFTELLDLQPGLAEAHRGLGYVHAQRRDWAKAEESYLRALELRPGDPKFVAALAQMYQDSGQEEKAVELMARAASENPEDARTQLNQGITLLSSGDSEKAALAFEAALAADSSTTEAHYHLGTILVGQGKIAEAVEHLEAYVAAKPDNAQYVATAQGLLEALKK